DWNEMSRLIVGWAGAKAGVFLGDHPGAADTNDDTRSVTRIIPIGAEAGEIIDRVEGDDQTGREPGSFTRRAALTERCGLIEIVGQNKAEALGRLFGAAVDAGLERGGEAGDLFSIDLREDIGTKHGEITGHIDQLLQIVEF